jgi:DNA polymerase sigma
VSAANTETLGELLLSFFDYWAWRHDYNSSVLSIRIGGTMSKKEKDWWVQC